ncbi:uncharacterized protein LOC127280442 [Leptopilina boulardi]|uniref:uncharacterized protein LOC127280442 n=1 Tax=Leptopilina boulardi TaxID=63433 RepID=UPI0021F5F353|nr:uncharacterized protein LOC127280442 [Leptopilina boulardi]
MNNEAHLVIGSTESELDSGYKKVLDLRKSINNEDNLLTKYNVRSLQVFKSNWKLNKKENDTLAKINSTNKTMANDSTMADSYKEGIGYAKNSKKQLLNKNTLEIKEQKRKFEKKFFNFYHYYDSKNLLITIDERRNLIKKEKNELKTIEKKEKSCKEKGKNVYGQNAFNYLFDFLCTEDSSILSENFLIKRENRDLTMKCFQNKNTIKEFSVQKSKYNL